MQYQLPTGTYYCKATSHRCFASRRGDGLCSEFADAATCLAAGHRVQVTVYSVAWFALPLCSLVHWATILCGPHVTVL